MAANDTAALVVALSAQLTKFEKDMNDAYGLADRGVRRIEDRFSKFNPNAGGVIAFAKKLIGVAGIAEIATKIQEAASEVGHLAESSERLGISIENFQRLRFAIVSAGGSLEEIDNGLDRFSRNVSEAAIGQGALAEWVRVNNVQLKDARGHLLPLNELLLKFADLLRGAISPQDRLNLAITAFGRQAGPALVSAFSQGSAALQQYMKNADAAGVVIEKEFVEHAREMERQGSLVWLKMKVPMLEFAVLLKESVTGGFQELLSVIKEASVAAEAFPNFAKRGVEGAIGDVLRQRGIDALKRGEGAPTQTDFTGFPGFPSTGPTKLTVTPDPFEKEFQKLLERSRLQAGLVDVETKSIGLSVAEHARLKTQLELESQSREKLIPLTDARRAQIDREASAVAAATQRLEDYKKRWEGINESVRFFATTAGDFLDILGDKSKKFSDVATSALRSFAKELQRAALTGEGAFAKLLGTASSVPGGAGGLAGIIAKAFGGGAGSAGFFGGSPATNPALVPLAGGTNFAPGGMALVGENGPEVINLPRGSQVIPNDVLKSGSLGSTAVTYAPNITISGSSTVTQEQLAAVLANERANVVPMIRDAVRRRAL